MAISEAYRRGYKRALQDASDLAFQRKVACEEAAEGYAKQKPDEPYWRQSETCAAREAGFIWEQILKLTPRADR
jgi:hypothetical protein